MVSDNQGTAYELENRAPEQGVNVGETARRLLRQMQDWIRCSGVAGGSIERLGAVDDTQNAERIVSQDSESFLKEETKRKGRRSLLTHMYEQRRRGMVQKSRIGVAKKASEERSKRWEA